jgi:hypothetical protein
MSAFNTILGTVSAQNFKYIYQNLLCYTNLHIEKETCNMALQKTARFTHKEKREPTGKIV